MLGSLLLREPRIPAHEDGAAHIQGVSSFLSEGSEEMSSQTCPVAYFPGDSEPSQEDSEDQASHKARDRIFHVWHNIGT